MDKNARTMYLLMQANRLAKRLNEDCKELPHQHKLLVTLLEELTETLLPLPEGE